VIVYERADAGHYEVVSKIQTAPGARTAFFSPELGQLYVVAPRRANPTAEILVYQVVPQMSFAINGYQCATQAAVRIEGLRWVKGVS
jgi:hypothetical protein